MPNESEFFQKFIGGLLDELECQIKEEPPVGEITKRTFSQPHPTATDSTLKRRK